MRIQSRAVTAALAVGLAGLTASLDRAARAAEPAGAVQSAPAPTLKRLPAGRDELVFHGESSTRIWPVYLSQTEASHAASLQLALLNAVVVLPERSALTVVINGRPFPALPVHSADKPTILSVRIPPGVLTAGVNKVQVTTTLAHRVDCSVPATYELWAQLDPARTGFVIDGAVATVHSLDDLAAEPTADDGATHIHLRMADPLSPDAVARASRLIDALVRRSRLPRPIVDIGPAPGEGPGFDVVLTPGSPADAGLENVRVLGRSDGATIARDADTKRLVIVMSGVDETQLDSAIDAIDGGGPKSSAAKSERASAPERGFRRSFADLGLAAEGFAGRRFAATAQIDLPADFFPVSSDKARLVLDGGHSNAVGKDSVLRFSVNGALAASLPLTPGKGERFERRGVELPLRLFHPGPNELAIEAITASPLDQQCDLSAQSREARLTLASTSELDFPSFTRLATVPRIPLMAGAAPDQRLQHLYLGSLDRDTVGAALTILANAAPAASGVEPPVLHAEPPVQGDVPGLVVAPFEQIPDTLSSQLRDVAAPASPADDAAAAAPAGGEATAASGADATARETGIASRVREALARIGRLADRDWLSFDGDDHAPILPLPARFVLIGAINPSPTTPKVGGVRLPQFVQDASQWLVATAPDAETLNAGVGHLVANGQWSGLAGQAAVLDLDTGHLQTAEPRRVAYVAPLGVGLANVRPILGGILADNILLSFAILIAVMAILGLSTQALVRRLGSR